MSKKIVENIILMQYHWEELEVADKALISKAKKALEHAYAPYSHFQVGAAVLLENGTFLTGNNQENASFPTGICAERVVLSYANANYPETRPLKIAIAAKAKNSRNHQTIFPCGICRQTIAEVEQKFKFPIKILLLCDNEEVLIAEGIDQLLPFKFSDFIAR
ncbi:cytidine deaminase [Echinicola jeungdonensis]|uniref:Cytidine deaminase n=1 Tax=Echinicola jeungdonensis TaxID=709343 RepID=A0ABV5J3C2_9BACT|nr:cytidine deaminase [Echinicola jeungdonensis]MDN3669579.1 cytidine deaminase [Echinicola jeungdonensis]